MPESVTDRCTKAHEYLFMLTKKAKYFWDAEAIREPHTNSHHNGERTEYDTKPTMGAGGQKGVQVGNNPNGRNRRSVWTIPTEPCPEAHFATYPKELVRPCILAGTSAKGYCPQCGKPWVRVVERNNPNKLDVGGKLEAVKGTGFRNDGNKRMGDPISTTTGWRPTCTCGCEETRPGIVLDPFGGSGTTGIVAAQEKREYILIELSEDYAENIARPRLAAVELSVPVSEQRAGQMALFPATAAGDAFDSGAAVGNGE